MPFKRGEREGAEVVLKPKYFSAPSRPPRLNRPALGQDRFLRPFATFCGQNGSGFVKYWPI